MLGGNKEQEKSYFNISLIIREIGIMAIMTINEVAKAGSASWTGNYSLIWSGLIVVGLSVVLCILSLLIYM